MWEIEAIAAVREFIERGGDVLLVIAFVLGVLSRRNKAGKFVMIATAVIGGLGGVTLLLLLLMVSGANSDRAEEMRQRARAASARAAYSTAPQSRPATQPSANP